MLHNGFYIIRPNTELLALLEHKDTDGSQILLEPQLWSNPEPDRSRWRPDDHIRRVKRAFVVHMCDVLRDDNELSLLKFSSTPDANDFDRWWSMERFANVHEELPEIEKTYGLKSS